MPYEGEERRKDLETRALFQRTCGSHEEILKFKESYESDKIDLARRNEACDLQVRQHEKDLLERKALHHACKAKTIPGIRDELKTNRDEMCKLLTRMKDAWSNKIDIVRNSLGSEITELTKRVTFVRGTSLLIGLFLSGSAAYSMSLHTDLDHMESRQTAIEITNGKIQSDVEYLKRQIDSIATIQDRQMQMTQEILRRLPREDK